MAHEIRLHGPIGGFMGFTADEIMSQIPDGTKEIIVRIHSPGGSVGEGLAIYHSLRDHPAHVTTIVDGYAASSASFVMLAGDTVQVHRNSIVFVHNPWTVAEGNADELRRTADGLDVHADAIRDIYLQHTGMDEDELREMMDETAFFRGVEAVKNGFADEVIDNPEAEAQIAAMFDMDALIAKHKETDMSKIKARKDITAELDSAKQELAEANTAHETAATEATAAIDELMGERDSATEQVADLTTERDGLLIDAEASTKEITTLKADAVKAETKATDAAEEIESVKAQLADPAFEDARKVALAKEDAAAVDAEATVSEEAASAKLADDAKTEANKGTWAEYRALPDDEKHAYYKENVDALKAALDADNA